MTTTLRPVRAAFLLAGLCLCLAACGGPPQRGGEAEPPAQQSAYAPPPELTDATRGADGGVTLSGRAPPESRVRLNSPEGQSLGATAGKDGAWSLALAPSATPRMFALSAEVAGRPVRGEGPVLVLPAPGPPALTPRAGFGALAVGRATTPTIVALDYDAGGGAAVAGLAAPKSSVRLLIDGMPAGSDQADDRGRFAIMAVGGPVSAGDRLVQVTTDAGGAQARVGLSAPTAPGAAAYLARREDGHWRIDWSLPGGGVQTTLVFDVAPSGSGGGAP